MLSEKEFDNGVSRHGSTMWKEGHGSLLFDAGFPIQWIMRQLKICEIDIEVCFTVSLHFVHFVFTVSLIVIPFFSDPSSIHKPLVSSLSPCVTPGRCRSIDSPSCSQCCGNGGIIFFPSNMKSRIAARRKLKENRRLQRKTVQCASYALNQRTQACRRCFFRDTPPLGNEGKTFFFSSVFYQTNTHNASLKTYVIL